MVTGPGGLKALEHRLRRLDASAFVVLGDRNTIRHCLPELLAHVPVLRNAATVEVEPGEVSKGLEVCRDIWTHLMGMAVDRHAVLVNLGGGVVTDLGGFIAATYKRGIRCVNVPTSLMGMVDAAIGGKTGIDLGGVKNVVGVFNDPLGTYVHVPFLKSLGKRELLNGLAEMIKHGLVYDEAHWRSIGTAPLQDLEAITPLVHRSAAIKAEVVTADPRESGPRKLLNFGHSIGHGIEAHSWESPGRVLLHGEAVAIGMVCEAWISWRKERIGREVFDGLAAQLLGMYPPYPFQADDEHRMLEIMRNDKKNASGEFRFTLLTGIGSAEADVPVTAALVRDALEQYRAMCG